MSLEISDLYIEDERKEKIYQQLTLYLINNMKEKGKRKNIYNCMCNAEMEPVPATGCSGPVRSGPGLDFCTGRLPVDRLRPANRSVTGGPVICQSILFFSVFLG